MSQFTVYSSADSGAPTLNGLTGSLLTVLDACLVTGYGSKTGAGWIKPMPNTGSYGAITQGSGSGYSLFISDIGSGSAGGLEAILTGWDSITSIQNGLTTGSNQFPTYVQSGFGQGGVIARKSNVTSSASRNWFIFADSSTLYGFVATLDVTGTYFAFAFGDFYSIKSGSSDTGKCMIVGRGLVNSPSSAAERFQILTGLSSAAGSHFAAHTYTGLGGSITIGKHGDGVKGSTSVFAGTTQYLNGPDGGHYISPVWVHENSTSTIRGRMRGLYQPLHAITNYTDQTVLSGSNDFPGVVLQVVKFGGSSADNVYLIDISNNLETN